MVRTIKMVLKVNDQFDATFFNSQGAECGQYSGYVPEFIPGSAMGGDYVSLRVDLETGKILNWNPVSQEAVTKLFQKEE